MIFAILLVTPIVLFFLFIEPTSDGKLYEDHFEDQDDFEDFMEADYFEQ